MTFYYEMDFTGKPDGLSIEKYITHYNLVYPQWWRSKVRDNLLEDVRTWWWNLANHERVYRLEDEEFEIFILDKWSRAKKKSNGIPIFYLIQGS